MLFFSLLFGAFEKYYINLQYKTNRNEQTYIYKFHKKVTI